MAIYVYEIADGTLISEIPDNITIAQAQAKGQLASDATLAAGGMAAVDGLPPLGPTVVWDPATKTTKTVTAKTPAAPMPTFFFISRFTAAEWATLQTAKSSDTKAQQFWDAINCTNTVDMVEPLIQSFGNYAVSKNWLTGARANEILTTPYVPSSMTG